MIERCDYLGNPSLMVKLPQPDILNQFQLNMMLTHPQLPIVPVQCAYFQGQETLIYNISGLRPALSQMENNPTQALLALIDALALLEAFHINLEQCVLMLDYLYWDDVNHRYRIVCVPSKRVLPLGRHQFSDLISEILTNERLFIHIKPKVTFAMLKWQSELKGGESQHRFDQLKSLLSDDDAVQDTCLSASALSVDSPNQSQNEPDSIRSNHLERHPSKSLKNDHSSFKTSKVMPSKFHLMKGLSNPKLKVCFTCGVLALIFAILILPLALEAKLGLGLIISALSLFAYQKIFMKNPVINGAPKNKVKDKRKSKEKTVVAYEEKNETMGLREVSPISGEYRNHKIQKEPPLQRQEVVKEVQLGATPNQTVLLNQVKENALRLVFEDRSLGQNAIGEGVHTIGRNPSICDINLEHLSIGRLHAEIHKHQSKCYIKDLNSTNGTFVNRGRILPNEYIEIKRGDQLTFGAIVAYLS